MTVLIKSDPDFLELSFFYKFLLLVFKEHALGRRLFLYMCRDRCNYETGVDRHSCMLGNIFIKLSPGIVLIFHLSLDFFSLYRYSPVCKSFLFCLLSTPTSLCILPASSFGA